MRNIPQPDKLSARRAKKTGLIKSFQVCVNNQQNQLIVKPAEIRKVISQALLSEKFNKTAQVNVCIVNDKMITVFNKTYLGHNYATDVVAFGNLRNDDSHSRCADIIVSAQTASANAKVFNTTALYELYLYIAHGLLHVLGYKDNTAPKRKIMQEKAERILVLSNVRSLVSKLTCEYRR